MRSYKKRRVGRIKKRKTKRRQKLRIKGGFKPKGIDDLNSYIDKNISTSLSRHIKKLILLYIDDQYKYKISTKEEDKIRISNNLRETIVTINNLLTSFDYHEDVKSGIWENITNILVKNELLN
jgi:hypothetical protein